MATDDVSEAEARLEQRLMVLEQRLLKLEKKQLEIELKQIEDGIRLEMRKRTQQ